ncbi:MAG: ATP-binding cassette domain-containing protein, partial [Acetobacteraceae bacterium]|nr:ATP-binding cassette domain-containing protein [Acetobacteraceae bacterium]
MAPILEVAGLCSSYGATPILRGVSLAVEKGDIVAIIGRNGVGKTTTLRCLIGLLRAAGGTIRYQGEEITHLPPDARARRGIGYIPQGREVFPRMTVEENLTVGALIGGDRARPR